MARRQPDTKFMTEEKSIKLVREGLHLAEVDVTLLVNDHEWSPYLSAADVHKLDTVRLALRRGDLKAAAALARVYELTPVAAE
jgi:hypothetical protein